MSGANPDTEASITLPKLAVIPHTITYTYDPLGRLTDAGYSTGESFAYDYDARRPERSHGNRAVMTSTTPLSGTLVTAYTFDAANRLTARSVSDGERAELRAYTYTWSQRGQLLAENTQGVDVRTFTYDGAGRLVEATVFTLTTRFQYNGLGARTHVEVVGHDTTTVTLDYAAGNVQKPGGLLPSRNAGGVSARILAETTLTGTVQYLYGRDCLGELRDDEPGLSGAEGWLYYQNDGNGLVRQGTDADGEIVSTWLFDPDGTVLEGPEGPVSHLVCGGVYDRSTGLIYKGGRYFDPNLGIWLALMPLVVVQSWRRKKRRGVLCGLALALFLVGVSGVLTGCEKCELPEQYCIDAVKAKPFGPPLNDRACFVDLAPNASVVLSSVVSGGVTTQKTLDSSKIQLRDWEKSKMGDAESALKNVIWDKYGGSDGFGDPETALTQLGISSDSPIILLSSETVKANVPARSEYPYLIVYEYWHDQTQQEEILTHEMAHHWESAHGDTLREEMVDKWTNWGDTATWYGTHCDKPDCKDEDFAEAVTVYFWPDWASEDDKKKREWTDDYGKGLTKYSWTTGPDQLKKDPEMDVADRNGSIQVCDRYDYLECKFTGNCLNGCSWNKP